MKQDLWSKSAKTLLLCLIIFSASFFTACNDDDNPIVPPAQTSELSITHASPDAPNVDIFIGTTLVRSNVAYLSTLQYVDLVPGNNQIVFKTAGTSTVLIDTTIFFQQDKFYSIFVMDSLANIQPLLVIDDLELPGSLNSNIRFINLSPNSPSVNIQAQGKANPWFPFYSFGQAADFRPVTAGTYNIEMISTVSATILLTAPNVVLTQGRIYTLISNGFVGGTGNQALGFTMITNYPIQNK